MSEYRRRTDFSCRTRTLYALVFDDERAVYIGQSINPTRRRYQHASKAGGWLRDFRMEELEVFYGTFAQAERREYVWRWVAHTKGWTVYVQPPNVRVNLGRRMGFWQRLEAWRTRLFVGWPVKRIR